MQQYSTTIKLESPELAKEYFKIISKELNCDQD
jgi:hypothetical protein